MIDDAHYRRMFHDLRRPVTELKTYIKDLAAQRPSLGIQKIQFFTAEPAVRTRMMDEIPKRFADLAVSSSHPQNVEINQSGANKGQALQALASYLDIPIEKTFAFGDGLNDLSMIQEAGIGVAMANACEAVIEAADYVTASCDEDGVAKAVEKFCLTE